MSDKAKIEWTDATWNPVTGCSKVSQGCKHCYAERLWPRMVKLVPAYSGRDFTDVRCHSERLDQPLRWTKRRMIFVNSMSDLFHEDVPDEFIDSVFAVMASADHVFQVLTKRPARMRQYLSDPDLEDRLTELWRADDPDRQTWNILLPLPNIWLGVSVEDQATADERIPLLLDTPAAVRWISAEPMLGPVRLSGLYGLITDDEDVRIDALNGTFVTSRYQEEPTPLCARLDWVVVGGESGPKARPMHPDWVRGLRDQCAAAGVPFLFKQWGEWTPGENVFKRTGSVQAATFFGGKWLIGTEDLACEDGHIDDEPDLYRVGKETAGRLLDGVTYDGYPNHGEVLSGNVIEW